MLSFLVFDDQQEFKVKSKRVPFVLAVVVLLMAVLVAACTTPPDSPDTERENDIGVIDNDLDGGAFAIDNTIGEDTPVPIDLRMIYSTNYSVDSWSITDSKSLLIRVELVRAPEGQQVFIEHMHADVNIQATRSAEIDGLQQDSMDDSLHSGDQPGFLITRDFDYEEEFAVEGYSETLISGWSFQQSEFGRGEIGEDRLTDCNLWDLGARFNQFTVVYDIVVGTPETGYHKEVVSDEVRVPVADPDC